jgi:hypothetical protein
LEDVEVCDGIERGEVPMGSDPPGILTFVIETSLVR